MITWRSDIPRATVDIDFHGGIMNKKQKELLLELICEKQIQMIVKDRDIYGSNDYADLEELKICVKNI